jgi:hypothetical protein
MMRFVHEENFVVKNITLGIKLRRVAPGNTLLLLGEGLGMRAKKDIIIRRIPYN